MPEISSDRQVLGGGLRVGGLIQGEARARPPAHGFPACGAHRLRDDEWPCIAPSRSQPGSVHHRHTTRRRLWHRHRTRRHLLRRGQLHRGGRLDRWPLPPRRNDSSHRPLLPAPQRPDHGSRLRRIGRLVRRRQHHVSGGSQPPQRRSHPRGWHRGSRVVASGPQRTRLVYGPARHDALHRWQLLRSEWPATQQRRRHRRHHRPAADMESESRRGSPSHRHGLLCGLPRRQFHQPRRHAAQSDRGRGSQHGRTADLESQFQRHGLHLGRQRVPRVRRRRLHQHRRTRTQPPRGT